MKRLVLATAAGLLGLAALPASAAPERSFVLDRDAVANSTITQSWDGKTGTGANTSWFLNDDTALGTCSDADATSVCDSTLIQIDPALTVDDTKASNRPDLTLRIQDFRQVDDFDLRVYKSNAAGDAVQHLGNPNGDADGQLNETSAGDFETFIVNNVKPGEYYLVEVVYFTVVQGTYKGVATLKGVPAQPPVTSPTP